MNIEMGIENLDGPIGWNSIKEKLLCLIALDDDKAQLLSGKAAPAFFRAFIVEDRVTKAITLRFRYKYIDGKDWYEVKNSKPEAISSETLMRFTTAIQFVLDMAARKCDIELKDTDIMLHYPPDDDGDVTKTLRWLIDQDLVEVKVVE